MKISADVLSEIDLDSAIEASAKAGIEHFPPLVSDMCQVGRHSVLGSYLNSRLEHNYPLSTEVIGYPRRTFGIRPIVVGSFGARVVYRALVQQIDPYLTLSSRGDGMYELHSRFGLESDSRYIVDFDIASCYEYIDHDILLEELVVRSSNVGVSSALIRYLGELQKRKLGVPQLSVESDILADTYLDIIDRRLRRIRYVTSRFADDFRILTSSFSNAVLAVERSSEFAREIGLVLSTEKTGIYKRSTLADRYESEEEILSKYFSDLENAEIQARFLMSGGYGEEVDLEDFDPDEVEFPAYHQVLADWSEALEDSEENAEVIDRLQSLIPKVLAVLRHDADEVDSDILLEIARENASRVESVVRYIVSRSEDVTTEDHWPTLVALTRNKRPGAWRKLWLIYAARVMRESESEYQAEVMDWLTEQVRDRYELVRGEAAWVLALQKRIDVNTVLGLYQKASELTRPLLAATLAIIDGTPPAVLSAVENDSPLMKAAIAWAK